MSLNERNLESASNRTCLPSQRPGRSTRFLCQLDVAALSSLVGTAVGASLSEGQMAEAENSGGVESPSRSTTSLPMASPCT